MITVIDQAVKQVGDKMQRQDTVLGYPCDPSSLWTECVMFKAYVGTLNFWEQGESFSSLP